MVITACALVVIEIVNFAVSWDLISSVRRTIEPQVDQKVFQFNVYACIAWIHRKNVATSLILGVRFNLEQKNCIFQKATKCVNILFNLPSNQIQQQIIRFLCYFVRNEFLRSR